MQNKKITKAPFFLALACLLVFQSGCGDAGRNEACETALLYADLIDESEKYSDEAVSEMIARVAQTGVPVTDASNRLSFENPEQIYSLAGEDGVVRGELTLVQICYDGGLIQTRLVSDGSSGTATLTRIVWNGDKPETGFIQTYPLETVYLTARKYLVFRCGIQNDSQSAHDGYIEPTTMIELELPGQELREYTENYLSPLGYKSGGLLTESWQGEECGELDLLTAYMSLYKLSHGQYITAYNNPYKAEESQRLAAVPEGELEALMQSYLPVTTEQLRAKLDYDAAKRVYLIDLDAADLAEPDEFLPRPEVIAAQRNADGSLELTVEAVFVKYGLDCALRHVVTVRPGGDGSFSYVSNSVEYIAPCMAELTAP